MKKLTGLLLICLLVFKYADAKIWRVNNTPGISANFTTPQAAHDAAGPGDTIHIESSDLEYPELTTTKRLVWLGIGYFLTDNPGNQFSTIPARVFAIYIHNGSENSLFSGFHAGNIAIYCANIVVQRCAAGQIVANASCTNAALIQNFVFNGIFVTDGQNIVITNNIAGNIYMASGSSAIITNNVFYDLPGYALPICNSIFQNNIFSRNATLIFLNSVVSYNFHPANGLPIGNNNQNNVNMSSVFVNSNGFVDKDFLLRTNSPAIGAGYAGSDLGAFGGNAPYKLALQAAIPAILNFNAPSSSVSHIIQGTFSAKTNN